MDDLLQRFFDSVYIDSFVRIGYSLSIYGELMITEDGVILNPETLEPLVLPSE
jgi:hypothetical protein